VTLSLHPILLALEIPLSVPETGPLCLKLEPRIVPPFAAGLEKLLDDRARLEGAAAAGDPGSHRMARTLRMQRQLQDIEAAQAAEIEAATAELTKLQQRCFPCLPAVGS
jgi:hypothetical protein